MSLKDDHGKGSVLAPYALSIRQPWAWAILHAGKTVENREWKSPPGHRGTLIVHTGTRREPRDLTDWWIAEPERANRPVPADLPLGAYLGTVELVGAHSSSACRHTLDAPPWLGFCSPWADADYRGDKHTWHLELRDPRPFPEPIPGKGQLGLWRPTVPLPIGARP
jgi:hypothetical protein